MPRLAKGPLRLTPGSLASNLLAVIRAAEGYPLTTAMLVHATQGEWQARSSVPSILTRLWRQGLVQRQLRPRFHQSPTSVWTVGENHPMEDTP